MNLNEALNIADESNKQVKRLEQLLLDVKENTTAINNTNEDVCKKIDELNYETHNFKMWFIWLFFIIPIICFILCLILNGCYAILVH